MMDRLTRREFVAVAGAASLAGCAGGVSGRTESGSGSGSGSGDGGSTPEPETTAGSVETTRRDTPTETRSPTPTPEERPSGSMPPTADRTLPLPMSGSDLQGRSRSGGPPKDGIPSIDEPSFVAPGKADEYLDPGDIVFGVERNGVAKAYPQTILVWHEICNDAIDGKPVSVTYCPLTGTAMGFDRGDTTFGVSGRLLNNNLIMYDRATETWWPQVLSTAIPGPWNESVEAVSLQEFRVIWTTWKRWKQQHPDTRVLSTDTGHARNYERDPYGSYNPTEGYYSRERTLFPVLNENDKYHPKKVVMGARTSEGAVAFVKESLRDQKLMEGRLADTPVLAVYDPALGTGYVYENPDGASFEFRDGAVVAGDGTEHAPGSLPLESVLAFDAMWFAWSGFYPDTGVYE